MNKKGLIQIYTGEGKGKTTAAVGLSVRARAYKAKICFISFHKDAARYGYGELKLLKKIGVDVYSFAKCHPLCPSSNKKIRHDEIRNMCLEGLEFIKRIYKPNKYDILILDEINICVRDGFLKEKEIISLLKKKPKSLEVVLTGRGASKGLIKCAHLVSYIKEIKHPFKQGQKRRKGIEY